MRECVSQNEKERESEWKSVMMPVFTPGCIRFPLILFSPFFGLCMQERKAFPLSLMTINLQPTGGYSTLFSTREKRGRWGSMCVCVTRIQNPFSPNVCFISAGHFYLLLLLFVSLLPVWCMCRCNSFIICLACFLIFADNQGERKGRMTCIHSLVCIRTRLCLLQGLRVSHQAAGSGPGKKNREEKERERIENESGCRRWKQEANDEFVPWERKGFCVSIIRSGLFVFPSLQRKMHHSLKQCFPLVRVLVSQIQVTAFCIRDVRPTRRLWSGGHWC